MDPLPQLSPEELKQDRSPLVLGVITMCLFISTGILVLRLWTRFHIVKRIGIDDWAAACSLISVLGCGIAQAVMTRYGLGRHQQTLTPEEMIKVAKCFWVSVLFYALGHILFKMAFLLQYYRVLVTHHMRKFYIAAMIFVMAWGIGVVVIMCIWCIPLDGFWDHSVQAKCLPQEVLYYEFGACSILTDVLIFLLPLPALIQLKLPKSQKIYLFGIFSLGFLLVAISVLRLRYLTVEPDFSWWNVDPAMWSIGELSAAMVCLCLPPLKALAARMGLIATRTEASRTAPSADQNSRGLASTAPLSPTPKAVETYTTNSPSEKPGSFGNFVMDSERCDDEVIRPSPAHMV
ncbi:hypothetical protein CORC01_08021 [Colletotrichum orchidophilum]|uniref:Rhodopsin domain-containing protein n=1 Tax=Colletotrichum orchidophilum TaxID=1209926 RepID=A0A1G4B5M5_9PEZI|nr:uncharacterized protein CORC01_08021 [Colletotrichum orchidophilum]OHE96704.1 hypothetical protein CORC01_08021 [Colletotrichum orchidophilum]